MVPFLWNMVYNQLTDIRVVFVVPSAGVSRRNRITLVILSCLHRPIYTYNMASATLYIYLAISIDSCYYCFGFRYGRCRLCGLCLSLDGTTSSTRDVESYRLMSATPNTPPTRRSRSSPVYSTTICR